MDIPSEEGPMSTFDINLQRVFVAHSLEHEGGKTVSPKLIEDNLLLFLVPIPEPVISCIIKLERVK